MQWNVLCSPRLPNIVSVNVLATARGQHPNCLVFTRPIGDSDPKQQSTSCYVLMQGFGMFFADRVRGKTAEAASRQSSSDRGSDGERKSPARGDNGE